MSLSQSLKETTQKQKEDSKNDYESDGEHGSETPDAAEGGEGNKLYMREANASC